MSRHLFLAFLIVLAMIKTSWSKPLEEVIQGEIDRSIAVYPYECPCPYSKNIDGELCGANSDYSNPTDYTPFCYP